MRWQTQAWIREKGVTAPQTVALIRNHEEKVSREIKEQIEAEIDSRIGSEMKRYLEDLPIF